MIGDVTLENVKRPVPGGGEDNWLMLKLEANPLDPSQQTNQHMQGVVTIGVPLRWRKIAAAVSTLTDYPSDGDGFTDFASGAETTKIFLDNAVPDLGTDYIGMYMAVLSGQAAGQVRRITAYAHTGGTQDRQVTVAVAFSPAPASGDGYRILIPVLGRHKLHLKAEFQNAASSQVECAGVFKVFGIPLDIAAPGLAVVVPNTDLTGDISQSGYKHGRVRSVEAEGMIGAKFRLTNAGGALVSLWAGAT